MENLALALIAVALVLAVVGAAQGARTARRVAAARIAELQQTITLTTALSVVIDRGGRQWAPLYRVTLDLDGRRSETGWMPATPTLLYLRGALDAADVATA